MSCWSLRIEAGPVGNIVVVRVAADIDMLTLPLVWCAVITALDNHPADLVLDISGVGFCGVRGFALLAAMCRVTAAGGIGYTISGLGRHHERGASLLWPDQQFVRACSTSAAVTAIREDRALRARPSQLRHPPGALLGRLRLHLLGAVAIVWSSVSGEGTE